MFKNISENNVPANNPNFSKYFLAVAIVKFDQILGKIVDSGEKNNLHTFLWDIPHYKVGKISKNFTVCISLLLFD